MLEVIVLESQRERDELFGCLGEFDNETAAGITEQRTRPHKLYGLSHQGSMP